MKCFHIFDDKEDLYMFDVYADDVDYDYVNDLTVFYRDGLIYCSMYHIYFLED